MAAATNRGNTVSHATCACVHIRAQDDLSCSLIDVSAIKRFYIQARFMHAVLHTKNVARGGKLSFQNVGGAKVYTMYYVFKSLGGQELT